MSLLSLSNSHITKTRYDVKLCEKRFRQRSPNLLISVFDKIECLSSIENILVRVAFNQGLCTFRVLKPNISLYVDLFANNNELNCIELTSEFDSGELCLENSCKVNEFMYTNVKCVRTMENFQLVTTELFLLNDLNQLNINYEIRENLLNLFSNLISLNGSFKVDKIKLYGKEVKFESQSRFEFVDQLYSNSHCFVQEKNSLVDLKKLRSNFHINATKNIRLSGEIYSDSVILDCLDAIDLSEGSKQTISKFSSFVSAKSIDHDATSFQSNGKMDIFSEKIHFNNNCSLNFGDCVLNIVGMEFTDSIGSIIKSNKDLVLKTQTIRRCHFNGKYWGSTAELSSDEILVAENTSTFNFTQYISIRSKETITLSSILCQADDFQAICSQNLNITRDFSAKFLNSMILSANQINLNGKIVQKQSNDNSRIFIGNYLDSIQVEKLIVNADMESSGSFKISDVVNISFGFESRLNSKIFQVNNSKNYMDSCSSKFDVDDMHIYSRESLKMSGDYVIRRMGLLECENEFELTEQALLVCECKTNAKSDAKSLILNAKSLFLAGRIINNLETIYVNVKDDIFVTTKLDLRRVKLIQFECNNFTVGNNASVVCYSSLTCLEIIAKGSFECAGKITDCKSLKINCLRFQINSTASIKSVSFYLNVKNEFKDDSNSLIESNFLNIQSIKTISIKGKYYHQLQAAENYIKLRTVKEGILINTDSLVHSDKVIFEAEKSLSINGTCRGSEANWDSMTEDIKLEQNASIIFSQKIKLIATNFVCATKSLNCENVFDCYVSNQVVVKKNSQINAKNIKIIGKSMKNYGSLIGGEKIDIFLKLYFIIDVLGLSESVVSTIFLNERSIDSSSENLEAKTILTMFSLKAKHIQIISSFYLNLFFSKIESDDFSVIALLTIDLLTMNMNFKHKKYALSNFDVCSCNIPNLLEIAKSIINFDIQRLNEIFFEGLDVKMAIGLFINSISIIFPQAGLFGQLGWNLFLLIFNLPRIINQAINFYKQGIKNIELFEIIPFIVGVKDLITQGYDVYSISKNVSLAGLKSDPPMSSIMSTSNFSKVGNMLVSTFSPSVTVYSLIDISYKNYTISGNLNKSSVLFALDYDNTKIALKIHQKFRVYKQISDQVFANSAIYDGTEMSTSSTIQVNKLQITLKKNLEQMGNSVLTTEECLIKCKNINQNGSAANLNTNSLILNVENEHKISDGAVFKSNQGQYTTKETQIAANGELNLGESTVVSEKIKINSVASNGKLLLKYLQNNSAASKYVRLENLENSVIDSYVAENQSNTAKIDNSGIDSMSSIENERNVIYEADDIDLAEFISTELKFDAKSKIEQERRLRIHLELDENSNIVGKSSKVLKEDVSTIKQDYNNDVDNLIEDVKSLKNTNNFNRVEKNANTVNIYHA